MPCPWLLVLKSCISISKLKLREFVQNDILLSSYPSHLPFHASIYLFFSLEFFIFYFYIFIVFIFKIFIYLFIMTNTYYDFIGFDDTY
jgi:hypothetical protein